MLAELAVNDAPAFAALVEAAKAEAVTEGLRQKALFDAELQASATRAREDLRRQVSLLAVTGADAYVSADWYVSPEIGRAHV